MSKHGVKLYKIPVKPGVYRQVLLALINLVAAEDQYVRESGMKLNDPISDAVEAARGVIREATGKTQARASGRAGLSRRGATR